MNLFSELYKFVLTSLISFFFFLGGVLLKTTFELKFKYLFKKEKKKKLKFKSCRLQVPTEINFRLSLKEIAPLLTQINEHYIYVLLDGYV